MNRPYYICYMIMSLDGRIDCPMTEHLTGSDDYYSVLDSLETPSHISGRVTAEIELAKPGKFISKTNKAIGETSFKKNSESKGYDIICDTKGSLLWDGKAQEEQPLLILTSENAKEDYLSYLDSLGISWIACGKDHIDFNKASEILYEEFKVKRASILGGGHINAGFLENHLIDEVVMIIGSGIDGRENQVSVFDGLKDDYPLTQLKLTDVSKLPSDAILLKYKVQY